MGEAIYSEAARVYDYMVFMKTIGSVVVAVYVQVFGTFIAVITFAKQTFLHISTTLYDKETSFCEANIFLTNT